MHAAAANRGTEVSKGSQCPRHIGENRVGCDGHNNDFRRNRRGIIGRAGMLRLFNKRSGAQDVELVRQAPAEAWGRLKRNLVRLLRESGYPHVIAVLEADAFELWDATNGFNDEF